MASFSQTEGLDRTRTFERLDTHYDGTSDSKCSSGQPEVLRLLESSEVELNDAPLAALAVRALRQTAERDRPHRGWTRNLTNERSCFPGEGLQNPDIESSE